MTEPELSIIIAASNAHQTIVECLSALRPQITGRAVEVFVSANYADDARLVRESFPETKLIEAARPRLIPELWGLATARARGRVIALTVATCIPDAHWIDEIIRAHDEPHAAIGGAIEQMQSSASLSDWAVYFVRYTPFMLPFRPGPIEVPGDNGTYKRAAIADQIDWIATHGFWETEVNAKLRAQQQTLWGDPRIIVYHQKSFGFRSFSRQRFEHGRIFGRMRAARSTPTKRLFYFLTAPAIPFVFLARIVRNLMRKKRHALSFMLSLPLTLWFLLCWATGEFLGLIGG